MSHKESIYELHSKGLTNIEISRTLGCSKSTVAYHLNKNSKEESKYSKRYDWTKVQAYYNSGKTKQECLTEFGLNVGTWAAARKSGRLSVRERRLPIKELLSSSTSARGNIKSRLIKEGLLKEACSICGLNMWCGRSLILVLDHINGVNNDHRLENLRLLCPNCNSQTETFAGRNVRNRKQLNIAI